MSTVVAQLMALERLVCEGAPLSDVINWLGIARPTEATSLVSVEPRHEFIRDASISITAGGEVDHVRLALAAACTVQDIEAVLGPPGELPRVHWDDPIDLVFRVPDGHGSCALIVSIEERGPGATVRDVTIRA